MEKSNEENDTSSIFLKNLDELALYSASQSTAPQKVFRKQNIALAIRTKPSSFTFIAKDRNNLLDIHSADGEITINYPWPWILFHNRFSLKQEVTKCILFCSNQHCYSQNHSRMRQCKVSSCPPVFLRERYTIFQMQLLLMFMIKVQTKLIKTKSAPANSGYSRKMVFVQFQILYFLHQLTLKEKFSNQLFCF